MDKTWVWHPRASLEYQTGATSFVHASATSLGNPSFMLCPCIDCRNLCHQATDTVIYHLVVETYEDKDGARDDEIAALGGQTATGTNVYSAFYDRLKENGMTPLHLVVWYSITLKGEQEDVAFMQAVINAKALQSYHLVEDTDDTYSSLR